MISHKEQLRSFLREYARSLEVDRAESERFMAGVQRESAFLTEQITLLREGIIDPCLTRIEAIDLVGRSPQGADIHELVEPIQENLRSIASQPELLNQIKNDLLELQNEILHYLSALENFESKLSGLRALLRKDETQREACRNDSQRLAEQRDALRKKDEAIRDEGRRLQEQIEQTDQESVRLKEYARQLNGQRDRAGLEEEHFRPKLAALQEEIAGLQTQYTAACQELQHVQESCLRRKSMIASLAKEIENILNRTQAHALHGLQQHVESVEYSIFRKTSWMEHAKLVMNKVTLDLQVKNSTRRCLNE